MVPGVFVAPSVTNRGASHPLVIVKRPSAVRNKEQLFIVIGENQTCRQDRTGEISLQLFCSNQDLMLKPIKQEIGRKWQDRQRNVQHQQLRIINGHYDA